MALKGRTLGTNTIRSTSYRYAFVRTVMRRPVLCLLVAAAALGGCTAPVDSEVVPEAELQSGGAARTELSADEARDLVMEIVGGTAEEIPDIAGQEAVEVQLLEDQVTEEPVSPIWFTLVDCDDGSRVADQVWVRDSEGTVHGIAIDFDC